TKDVNYVLSLANVDDYTVDPMGGVVTDMLVNTIPTSDAEKEAMREKVMSRDQVVGNLVAADGKGVMMYVFVAHGAEPRLLADTVREIVQKGFPDNKLYWGGAPYISTYIYDTTQADMARLTPWAVAVIILIILLSFRDVAGSILALVTTAMGIVVSQGAMWALGVSYNIVLSSMPVILFAVGSAYSIHMLSRYYANVGTSGDKDAALRRTIIDTGPTVIAAGLTTVAGLLSFIMMDIKPMRTFGTFTALGIFTTLVLSVTFVPAVIRVIGLGGWKEGTTPFRQYMIDFTVLARNNRAVFGTLLVIVALIGGIFVGQVDNRMDQGTFFAEGSPPDQAQKFMDEHFGGSQFLQVEVRADLNQPAVLRELQYMADEFVLVDNVSSVNHIPGVVSMINDAMDGIRRVPDQANQVGVLFGFLAGRPAVGQLVTDDKTAALMHIKIGSNSADTLDAVLASVHEIVGSRPATYKIVPAAQARDRALDMAAARVRALSHAFAVTLDVDDEV
ncbi:MAG: MMPL family transporter, partial [Myxococcota bacterium]